MNAPDPYATPRSRLADPAGASNLDTVASGQQMMIAAIGLYLVAGFARGALGTASAVVGLAALVIGLIGVVRLGGALGSSGLTRVLLVISMFVPLLNLVVLLVLNSRATRVLRDGGWTVGLFGARRP